MSAPAEPAGGPAGRYELGVDIGGTFTDFVLRDAQTGRLHLGKTPTTAADPARGALAGLAALLAEAGVPAGAVARVVHGTTLVTNTLIERTGARTAYVTTAGFADVFETGRQKRYDMYDLGLRFPEPLVPRGMRFEVDERTDASGRVRRALDPAAAAILARRLRDAGAEAVAVCFLHAYRAPAHEVALGAALSRAAPELPVSLSCEVAPEIREYPRASTTAANAYVGRAAGAYLRRFEDGLRRMGCPAVLHVILSHGGLATPAAVERVPIQLVESGPAGGAQVAAYHAGRLPSPRALAFDMGGTTAKVCLVADGVPRVTHHVEVARVHRLKRGSGLPLTVPCVDLIEIGAGGGSIVRVDALGLLRVGPDSAGADPGPACYGRGGTAPTVTDADLVLGFLAPDRFLGGAMPLDPRAARDALWRDVARPQGTDVQAAAWAAHLAVNEAMAGAARVHAAERGQDLGRVDVIAFGGAGPVHAERVARALRVPRVVVPYGAGAASAFGFLVAPVAFDLAHSAPGPVDGVDADELAARYRVLSTRGRALVAGAGVPPAAVVEEWSADMRYAGQGYEVAVSFRCPPWRLGPAGLRSAFEAHYQALYGRTQPGATVEVVTWRLRCRGPRPRQPAPRHAPGPAIIEEPESTTVVGPGSRLEVDAWLNLLISLPGTSAGATGTPAAPGLAAPPG